MAALLLHLGNHLQRQRSFTGRLGAVDFDDTAAGQATYAQCDVQTQGASGNHLNVFNHFTFAQAHDGALAELLFDLGQGYLQGLGFFSVGAIGVVEVLNGCVHENLLKNQSISAIQVSVINYRLDT